MIIDPEPAVTDLFCFLLDVKSIKGTLVEHMVKKVTSKGNKDANKQAYKLKATTGRLCARRNLYSQAQQDKIDTEMRDFMHFWGYSNPPANQESVTVFANYKD